MAADVSGADGGHCGPEQKKPDEPLNDESGPGKRRRMAHDRHRKGRQPPNDHKAAQQPAKRPVKLWPVPDHDDGRREQEGKRRSQHVGRK